MNPPSRSQKNRRAIACWSRASVSYLPKDDGRNHFQQSQQLQQLVKMEEKRKQLSNIKGDRIAKPIGPKTGPERILKQPQMTHNDRATRKLMSG
jgi:hypothetical protein